MFSKSSQPHYIEKTYCYYDHHKNQNFSFQQVVNRKSDKRDVYTHHDQMILDKLETNIGRGPHLLPIPFVIRNYDSERLNYNAQSILKWHMKIIINYLSHSSDTVTLLAYDTEIERLSYLVSVLVTCGLVRVEYTNCFQIVDTYQSKVTVVVKRTKQFEVQYLSERDYKQEKFKIQTQLTTKMIFEKCQSTKLEFKDCEGKIGEECHKDLEESAKSLESEVKNQPENIPNPEKSSFVVEEDDDFIIMKIQSQDNYKNIKNELPLNQDQDQDVPQAPVNGKQIQEECKNDGDDSSNGSYDFEEVYNDQMTSFNIWSTENEEIYADQINQKIQ